MSEANLLRFLESVLQRYFSTRATKKSVERAYKKLKEKTKTATTIGQLHIIGDMSKRIFEHVPERSGFKNFAWDRHMEVDREIQKSNQRLQTETKTKLGGKLGTSGVGIEAGRERRTKLRFI